MNPGIPWESQDFRDWLKAELELVGPRTHLQGAVPSSGRKGQEREGEPPSSSQGHSLGWEGASGRGLSSMVSRVWHSVALHK